MSEQDLLSAARAGDEAAFGRLVGPYRSELSAHCYRMLGSIHDAEDALQDALLRAWRALDRFEGRSSLRSWLYTIATNVCLRAIERRPKRVLPIDYGPAATDPHGPLAGPLVESVWVDPYPSPDARYEQRESVELAFIAALQHLPARQRAVLILRDVLGFSGAEVATALDTTPASVYSLLQRAHATLADRLPDRSQQATLRALGDEQLRALVDRYVDAWAQGDVDTIAGMLTDTATLAMPPTAAWLRGRDAIAAFLRAAPLDGSRHWRLVPTSANGQPAMGVYLLDRSGAHLPYGVTLLSLRGASIAEVDIFRDPSAPERFGLPRRP
jgi:RNA polymerase sigma-70 factor, ECF subfamily